MGVLLTVDATAVAGGDVLAAVVQAGETYSGRTGTSVPAARPWQWLSNPAVADSVLAVAVRIANERAGREAEADAAPRCHSCGLVKDARHPAWREGPYSVTVDGNRQPVCTPCHDRAVNDARLALAEKKAARLR